MEEGVSPYLSRDGFPVANHLLVSVNIQFVFFVPYAREHGFSLTTRGGLILKEVSLPLIWAAEDGSQPKGMEEVAPCQANGLCDASRHGAEQGLPISGQQVPLFIGSGDSSGDMPRSWILYLRKPDLVGLASHDPDSGEEGVKGIRSSMSTTVRASGLTKNGSKTTEGNVDAADAVPGANANVWRSTPMNPDLVRSVTVYCRFRIRSSQLRWCVPSSYEVGERVQHGSIDLKDSVVVEVGLRACRQRFNLEQDFHAVGDDSGSGLGFMLLVRLFVDFGRESLMGLVEIVLQPLDTSTISMVDFDLR